MKLSQITSPIVALLCAAANAAWAANAVDVPLRIQRGSNVHAYGERYVALDEAGEGSMPFTTACGELKMRLVDDALLLDRNGDGTLNDADGAPVGNDETAEIAAHPFGTRASYPINVRICSDRRVRLQSQIVVKGEKDGATYELHDGNLDGRFDEYGTDMFRIKGAWQCLAKVVRIDTELHGITVARNGGALRLSPYTGPLANVTVSCGEGGWLPELHVKHKDGEYIGKVALGMPIPPGQYTIQGVRLIGTVSDGSATGRRRVFLHGYDPEEETVLTLKEGSGTLTLGPPLKLAVKAVKLADDASKVKVVRASLIGVAGEKYRALATGDRVTSTLECWVRTGGKEEKLTTMRFG